MLFVAYRLSEIFRQPLTGWKAWSIIFQTIPEATGTWRLNRNFSFLNQLLPLSFEPFGDLLNITIVLIIVITSICKSRALNTSTSFHFIFYHKLKKNRTMCRDIFFDWLPTLLQRSRTIPCFLTPGYQEQGRWGCVLLPAMGSRAVIADTKGINVSPSLLGFVLFITLLGGL